MSSLETDLLRLVEEICVQLGTGDLAKFVLKYNYFFKIKGIDYCFLHCTIDWNVVIPHCCSLRAVPLLYVFWWVRQHRFHNNRS